jgi:hypothetical protein
MTHRLNTLQNQDSNNIAKIVVVFNNATFSSSSSSF